LARHLIEVIGAEVQILLPDILFPFLEKASSPGNHPNVQQAALKALHSLSFVTSNQNVAFLLAENFDYIADTALSRVRPLVGRQSSKKILPPSLPRVIQVVLQLCNSFFEERMNSSYLSETHHHSDPLILRSKAYLVNDIIGALIEAFDQNVVRFTSKTKMSPNVDRFLPESIIAMFESAVEFFHLVSEASRRNENAGHTHPNNKVLRNCSTEVWLEHLLNEFRIQQQQSTLIHDAEGEDEDSTLTPEAGFKKYHSDQQERDGTDRRFDQNESRNIRSDHVHFPGEIVLRIMIRCSFFLSFPDLIIQKSSVRVIQASVQYLAVTASEEKKVIEDDEGRGSEFCRNELLPSINQIWPPILARLRFTAEKIIASREAQSPIKISPRQMLCSTNEEEKIAPGYSLSSFPFFFQSLLDLVASLCEVSGDFMKSRFEHDAWPLIAKLLGVHAKRLLSVTATTTVERVYETEIISMLNCVRRVYTAQDCGLCLVHLIPVVSIIVLPFIQHPSKIGDEAVSTIEALMRIDRCCLYRELHSISRCKWGLNPLEVATTSADTITAVATPDLCGVENERDATMIRRASYLITYASQLEEQLLF
jgi:hypothetical protein